MKLPIICEAITSTGKITLSLGAAAVSSFIAKRIYDISMQIIKERTPCYYIDLACMGAISLQAAYLSFKIWQNIKPIPQKQEQYHIREICAFHPGEGALARNS